MKTCTKCKGSKPETPKYFYRYSRGHKGLGSQCKKCVDLRNREYGKLNREKLLKKRRAYYGGASANPRGIWGQLGDRLNGRRKNGAKRCSSDEFVEWYNSQPFVCIYCGILPEMLHTDSINTNKRHTINRLSIDRKDPKGDYKPSNMVLACMRCNWIKSDFFTYEEMLEIGNKYVRPKRAPQHITV